MGAYINPPNETKEDFLKREGTPYIPMDGRSPGHMPVVLVDNGMFTAAAIAFDENEEEYFAQPDNRPMIWFQVEIEKLLTVSHELPAYMERTGRKISKSSKY